MQLKQIMVWPLYEEKVKGPGALMLCVATLLHVHNIKLHVFLLALDMVTLTLLLTSQGQLSHHIAFEM